MSFSETLEKFDELSDRLLELMELEAAYLKDSRITLLDSSPLKKDEAFGLHLKYADSLLEFFRDGFDSSIKAKFGETLKKIAEAMKTNASLLAVAAKGNRKLMELYFKNGLRYPVNYSALGKLGDRSRGRNVGINRVY